MRFDLGLRLYGPEAKPNVPTVAPRAKDRGKSDKATITLMMMRPTLLMMSRRSDLNCNGSNLLSKHLQGARGKRTIRRVVECKPRDA